MNTSKKWMVSLAEDKYEWVKKVADEAEISGSAVIEESLSRAMIDKGFRIGLIEAKTQIRLRELNERRLSLEEEIKMLRAKGNVVGKIFA